MRNVNFGQNDKHPLKGQNVIGITLTAKLQHTTVNTAFAGQPIDWSQVNVSAILKRKGNDITIFDDVALPLLLDSGFLLGFFDECNGVSSSFRVLQAHGASVKAIIEVTGKILLHDIINVQGDDELVVEINPLISAVNVANVDTSNSQVQWDWEEGVGNALSVPSMKAETVRANESSTSFTLGDGVVKISFINNDKTGITVANQVIQSTSLNTDKLKRRDTYDELLSKRSMFFPSLSQADARHQSHILFDLENEKYTGQDVRLNSVDLRVNFVPANVAAGKNWVVYRRFVNDGATLQAAVGRFQRHAAVNNAQYM